MNSRKFLTSSVKPTRNELKRPSLLRWLFLSLVLTFASAQFILFGIIFLREYQRNETEKASLLKDRVEFILSKNEEARISGNFSLLTRVLYEIQGSEGASLLGKDCQTLGAEPLNENPVVDCHHHIFKNGWLFIPYNDAYSLIGGVALKKQNRIWSEVWSAFLSSYALFFGYSIALALISLFWMRRYFFKQLEGVVESIKSLGGAAPSQGQEIRPEQYPIELVPLYDALSSTKQDLEAANRKIQEQSRLEALNEIASQVSHDIRAPLSALEGMIKLLPAISEEKSIPIRGAMGRIRDIANNLLQKNREAFRNVQDSSRGHLTSPRSPCLLSSLIEGLVSEKRMQYRTKIGIEIDSDIANASHGLFALIDPVEFQRILSNLVENAVEALGDKGMVKVSLGNADGQALVLVNDNGRGIPPDILGRLGLRGATFGKEGGSGYGLYHARTTVESWGGEWKIESTVPGGTTVTVKLALSEAPKWFQSEIRLQPSSTVVVLDDDISIHQIWDLHFKEILAANPGISIKHFATPDQFQEWIVGSDRTKPVLFLMDYDLKGFQETGLSIIESEQLQGRSVLVTSRYDEEEIRARCESLGVPQIPKPIAGYTPIVVSSVTNPDCIFIDDDLVYRQVWEIAGREYGKTVLTYSDSRRFFEQCADLARSVPVFVDVRLSNDERGEAVARRIHEMGFTSVYLATGDSPEQYANLTFIKGVVGKVFPDDLI